MASSKRALELAFAIGGKLNPDFINAAGEAGKKLKELSKKSEEAVAMSRLAKEQSAMFDKLGKEASGVGQAWSNVGSAIMGPLKTIAKIGAMGAAAGASIYALAAKTAQFGDAAVKAAKKTGMTTEAFSSLSYAAQLSNVSQESLSGNLVKFNKNISAAAKGNKEAELAFRRAGVSIFDMNGKLRSTDDIMMDASKMFAKMPEGIYKADLAMALFGKSGAEMVPLMEQGSEEIRKLRQDAERLGITFDDMEGMRATAFADSITTAKAAMQGLAIAVGKQLHGPLTEITNDFTEWIVANREWISLKAGEYIEMFKQHLPEIKQFLLDAKDAVVSFAKKIDDIAQSFGGWDEMIKEVATGFAVFNVAKIGIEFADAAIKTANFVRSIANFAPVLLTVGKAFLGAFGPWGLIIGGAIAAGILLYKNWDFVKEKVVAAAMFIYEKVTAAFDWISTGIVEGFTAAKDFLFGIWDGITGFFGEKIDNIKAMFGDGLIAGIAQIWKEFNIFSLVNDAVNGIFGIDMLGEVKGWLQPAIDFIWEGMNFVSESFFGVFDGVIEFFGQKIDNIKAMFGEGFLNGIAQIFREFSPLGMLNDLISKFFGIDLLAKGSEWIQSFIDGIVNALKGAAGAIGAAVSGLVPDGIKSLASGIKNVAGGILPKFADGGIISSPQIAMVGEAGPEAVIPLSKPARAMEIMRQAMPEASRSPAQTLSTAINNSKTNNSIGGASFNFAPNVTINGNGGDAGGIAAAVHSAFLDLKNEFEKFIEDRERNLARVAMA